jgi:CHAT domain-containing protein/DNA-directed RNA polymerase specialized sigma24 family protein
VEALIRDQSPHYSALVQPQPASLASLQGLLKPDTALLEFFLGSRRSFLWVVTRSAISLFPLPDRAAIEADAREVIELIREPRARARQAEVAGKYQRAAASLSRKLFGEARGRIGARKLLLVADGILHYVPFAALPSPDNPETPLGFLHEIVYVPSGSTAALLHRQQGAHVQATKTLAVFADPRYQVKSLPGSHASGAPAQLNLAPLPYTLREAESLRRLVPADQLTINLGSQANKQEFLLMNAARYRFVHLAVHGRVDDLHPEASWLAFAMSGADGSHLDGLLRVYETYNLDLPVELVVASACETGLGGEVRGEGLIGFTRAFFYAGAARVLVSLWPVRDDPTAELMALFYEAMLGPMKLPPAAALRHAQERMGAGGRTRTTGRRSRCTGCGSSRVEQGIVVNDNPLNDPFEGLSNDDPSAPVTFEQLRTRLIFYFRHRRCSEPEELTGEAFARAWRRHSEGAKITTELLHYLFGIAANLVHEHRSRHVEDELTQTTGPRKTGSPLELNSVELRLLAERYLHRLAPGEADLLRRYFREDHKALAQDLGLTPNALRIRVHRCLDKIRETAA